MVKQGNIADAEEYKKKVFAREEEGSTGVGEGVAIPHAKTAAVTKPGLAFMRCRDGVEFDSLDGQPAKLFFLIAAPDTKDNVHLDVLVELSTLLMDPDFIDGLMAVDSVDALYEMIAKAVKEKFPEEEPQGRSTGRGRGSKTGRVPGSRRDGLPHGHRPYVHGRRAWNSTLRNGAFPLKWKPTARAG